MIKRIFFMLIFILIPSISSAQFGGASSSAQPKEVYTETWDGHGGDHPYGAYIPPAPFDDEYWICQTGSDAIDAFYKSTGLFKRRILYVAGLHPNNVQVVGGKLYTNFYITGSPGVCVINDPSLSNQTACDSTFGSSGTGDGQFNHSYGLAIYNNEIYVCDQGNARIQVLNMSGVFQRKWSLNDPVHAVCEQLWIHDAGTGAGKELYAPAGGTEGIYVYSLNGTLNRQIGAGAFSDSPTPNFRHGGIIPETNEIMVGGYEGSNSSQLYIFDAKTGERKRSLGRYIDLDVCTSCGLGAWQYTGNLVVGQWYTILTTETDHFFPGCKVGDRFRATEATVVNVQNEVYPPCNEVATFNSPGAVNLDGCRLLITDIGNYRAQVWDYSSILGCNMVKVFPGSGGLISPSTKSYINGSNQTFTITPGSGKAISDVILDGVSQGAIGSLDLTNITKMHKIEASFSTIMVPYCTNGTGDSGADLLCEDVGGSNSCVSGGPTNCRYGPNLWVRYGQGTGGDINFSAATPSGTNCAYTPTNAIRINKTNTASTHLSLYRTTGTLSTPYSMAFDWYFAGTNLIDGNEISIATASYGQGYNKGPTFKLLRTGSQYFIKGYYWNNSSTVVSCATGDIPVTVGNWYPMRLMQNGTSQLKLEVDYGNIGNFTTLCNITSNIKASTYPETIEFGQGNINITDTFDFYYANIGLSSTVPANSCSR